MAKATRQTTEWRFMAIPEFREGTMAQHRGVDSAERLPMPFTQSGPVRDHACVQREPVA
jgi:hypothetical protein